MMIEIIPDFEPNFAASDFENAPRNAFQKQFPGNIIQDAIFIIHKLFGIESDKLD